MIDKNFFNKKYKFYKKKKNSLGNLLFVDRERIDTLFQLSIFSLALSNKFKLNTTILTDQKPNSMIINTYIKLGYNNFVSGFSKKKIFLNPFLLLVSLYYFTASLIKIKFNGFNWLINKFDINDILIGDLIYDTNIRYEQRFINPKLDFYFLKIHFTSIFRFLIIQKYLKKLKIKKILIGTETGSRNHGLTLRIGTKLGIKNYAYFRLSKNGVSIISYDKNYYKNGIDCISLKKFNHISSKISQKKVNNFYKNRIKFNTTNWYTNHDYVISNQNSIKGYEFLKHLQKEKKKKFLFASHAFADAPHAPGKFIFNDYYEQFTETLKFAYKSNENVIWIFKNHPNSRLYGEKKIFKDLISKYKKDNIFLCPERVPVQDLLEVCDVVITGRGTIGIEFACLGKKVVTAGSSPYSKIAIAYEAKNKTSYFKYIDDIIKFQNFKKSKKIEINAKKLLYIFENSLNVQTISTKDLSKDKKYKIFLNSIHTKNFKRNSTFLLFNKILQNGITNSEIYKKLIKII